MVSVFNNLVNKAFWEPKVKDLLVQVKALDSSSATYVDDLAALTEQLEAIDPAGEPIFGPWQLKKWEVGAYVENILNPKNWFIGVQIQEFVNGAYREFKPDGSYDFSAYGDATGDKSLELTTGPFFKSAIYSVYDQDAATLALRNNDVDFILFYYKYKCINLLVANTLYSRFYRSWRKSGWHRR